MANIRSYVAAEIEIRMSDDKMVVLREGWRSVLKNKDSQDTDLSYHLAGQIPYFYREPGKIANDFAARHNALDMVIDLATKAPTTTKFQNSHCGEILSALFIEDCLGFRRLYSKLTLTTAENTNVHKMDGFFVDVLSEPYRYLAVEAKTSVLPTAQTKFSGHRYGILNQLIESLDSYGSADERFDFAVIRDNLEEGIFEKEQRERIRAELIPPGPRNLSHLGVAVINDTTIAQPDDDYILCQPCGKSFNYRALIVSDLASLARESYNHVIKLKNAGK